MTAFKVGDRVRCIDPGHGNGLTKGAEYTVLEGVDASVIRVDNGRGAVYAYRFELVEEPVPEPAEWTPGEGWREVPETRQVLKMPYLVYADGEKVRYWVREEPVPALPTEPHTVILTRSRKGWDDWEVKLDADGTLWRRTTKSDVTFEPDELARLIHSFEVLSEPRAVTARAVLDQVEARGYSGAWHTTLIDVVDEIEAAS